LLCDSPLKRKQNNENENQGLIRPVGRIDRGVGRLRRKRAAQGCSLRMVVSEEYWN
jgi:hypothetical protein